MIPAVRWVLLLVLPIALAGQQQTVVLEGSVRDATTGAPVQGVKVAVYYPSTMGTGFPTMAWPVVAQGNPFHYEVLKPEQRMSIQVWADGYRRQIEPIRGEALERHDFTLTSASPASGRLVDAATGAPVADVEIMVGRAKSDTVVEIDPAPNFARTDQQGRFHFDDVGTGGFVLRVMSAIRILSESDARDVPVIRNGYVRQWVTGDLTGDLASALASAYNGPSGKTLEFGDLRVRRSDLFTLSGQLEADGCTGQPYFNLVQQDGKYWGKLTAGSIGCGQRFTIPNLPAGTYYLFTVNFGQPLQTMVAVQVRISTQDVRQDLRMVPNQQVPGDAFPDDLRRQMTTSGVGSW